MNLHGKRVHAITTLAAVAIVAAAGCAKTTVGMIQEYNGKRPLPRPERVFVHDFSVLPEDVSVNSAIGARALHLITGDSTTEEQTVVGRTVARALSEELVLKLQRLGFPATRIVSAQLPPDRTLMIEGQFVTVDEGNRLRRIMIGFGAGGTEVRTQVQASLGTASGRLLLEEFVTDAESSKKPGMGPTVGVGGLVTGVAAAAVVSGGVGAATEMDQTAEGDARRTADEIAKTLSALFVRLGWIPKEYLIP